MNEETYQKTDFNVIRQQVAKLATSEAAQTRLQHMTILTNLAEVQALQTETVEARQLLDANVHLPFLSLDTVQNLLTKLHRGYLLTAEQLVQVADFVRGNADVVTVLKRNATIAPTLASYADALTSVTELADDIYNVIHNNQVIDDATGNLRKLRRHQRDVQAQVQAVVQKASQRYARMLQERLPVTKADQLVLAVQATFKNQVPGTVVGSSATGSTIYIEPQTAIRLNSELAEVTSGVEAEVYQILAGLNGRVSEYETTILRNLDVITALDEIMARGKYSASINGVRPHLNERDQVKIDKGRHPLLGKHAVPLSVRLGYDHRGLIITGPNAGGKTIVLKTIGLFIIMAQCGLQVPAADTTELPILQQMFADIGDDQSIENALSTFSSHLTNLTAITNAIKPHSLVLLDEIGSGTEPNEGAALAIAVIEYLYQHGALVVVTTHYGEIKRYAQQHPAFTTAAMAFDEATLMPKYQLLMNEVGDSNAFWLARRLKLNPNIIEQADHYLTDHDYRTDIYQMKAVQHVEKREQITYTQGDRVRLNTDGRQGLVYAQDKQAEAVTVYVNNQFETIPERRLTRLGKAADLYPAGYDMTRLFKKYDDYKFQRDLDRGSMKAQKKLDKQMRQLQDDRRQS